MCRYLWEKDSGQVEVMIQLFYSCRCKKVPALKWTLSMKVKMTLWRTFLSLTESCIILIQFRLLILKVKSEWFVQAVCKSTGKIVDCWLSFPGCYISAFWVGKASRAQRKNSGRLSTLTRLFSLFGSPSLSTSVVLCLPWCFVSLHLLCVICTDQFKSVLRCWEGGSVQWC